jgi:raffinose/stachyose/melibiose transport system substrate-binding protein
MIELTQTGAFGNSPLEIDKVTATAQFLTGAAAMALEGTWYTNGIYESEDSAIAEKVKAVPFPMVTGGKGKSTDYMGGFIDGVFVIQIRFTTSTSRKTSDFRWRLYST